MKLSKNKKQTATRRTPGNQPDAKVFSYYSNRSATDSKQGRLTKKVKKGISWQLIPTFIALIAILISLMYMSTLDTKPLLKIKGAKTSPLLRSESVYSSEAQRLLQGSVLNRSKLLIDTKRLEAQLREKFPELRTVGIAIPLTSHRPIVTVEAVEPKLMLTTKQGTYLIDERGRAVLKVDQPDSFKVPLITDETGLDLTIGKIAMSSRDTAFVSEVSHQLAEKSLAAQSLTLPAIANEMHVRLEGDPYFVKFNMLGDARLQAGGLVALRQRLAKDGIKPSEYIDVRVEEKAFYR